MFGFVHAECVTALFFATLEKGAMANTTNVWSWTLAVILGVVFLGAGIPKLLGVDFMYDYLLALQVPLWAIPVIGIIELTGAVLTFSPKTRLYGASILLVVMIGAAGTHILNADWIGLLPPVVLGVLAGTLTYLHREEIARETRRISTSRQTRH